jgi:hypothetical protein
LNDTVIDFYVKYIECELLSADQRSQCHFFGSYFWRKLSEVIIYSLYSRTPPPLKPTAFSSSSARIAVGTAFTTVVRLLSGAWDDGRTWCKIWAPL